MDPLASMLPANASDCLRLALVHRASIAEGLKCRAPVTTQTPALRALDQEYAAEPA